MEISGPDLEELILSMIKADMKNTRLIMGLCDAGLTADGFYSGLPTSILKMTGFSEAELEDSLFEFYDTTMERLIGTGINEFHEHISGLSTSFYQELSEERRRRMKRIE